VADELEEVRQQAKQVAEVKACLEEPAGSCAERQRLFEELRQGFAAASEPFAQHLAEQMGRWQAGLFSGGDALGLPEDNLELERWFRLPKSHERRIHGHAHAGVRIVQEGPTLVLVLNAHENHPKPFTAEDLMPYRDTEEPACQREALHRRTIMRRARSKKQRPLLLAELEQRCRDGS
jgi:hypothetical protein